MTSRGRAAADPTNEHSDRHEVRLSDGSLVAADHDRGAFVDATGRLRLAPDGLIQDLLRGDPDEHLQGGDTVLGPDPPATT